MRKKRNVVDLHEPVRARHLEVKVEDQRDIERAIRKFTKKVRLDGILQEYSKKQRFVKPSEAKRQKRMAAQRMRQLG